MEGIIKATWEVLAKSTYTDNLNKLRKHGRPVHVTKFIWEGGMKHGVLQSFRLD